MTSPTTIPRRKETTMMTGSTSPSLIEDPQTIESRIRRTREEISWKKRDIKECRDRTEMIRKAQWDYVLRRRDRDDSIEAHVEKTVAVCAVTGVLGRRQTKKLERLKTEKERMEDRVREDRQQLEQAREEEKQRAQEKRREEQKREQRNARARNRYAQKKKTRDKGRDRADGQDHEPDPF